MAVLGPELGKAPRELHRADRNHWRRRKRLPTLLQGYIIATSTQLPTPAKKPPAKLAGARL